MKPSRSCVQLRHLLRRERLAAGGLEDVRRDVGQARLLDVAERVAADDVGDLVRQDAGELVLGLRVFTAVVVTKMKPPGAAKALIWSDCTTTKCQPEMGAGRSPER